MRNVTNWSLILAICVAGGSGFAAADTWLEDPASGCALWSSDELKPGEGVSWFGACHEGKASGKGVGVWYDNDGPLVRFDGEMEGGKINGHADLLFRTLKGDGYWTYSGEFADGEPIGEGVLVTEEGYRFRGELLDGIEHARGTVITPEGSVIRGEFVDGKTVGSALAYYQTENNETYLGEVEGGKRDGIGKLLKQNDDLYVGEFREGKASGYGTFFAADGGEYVGVFAEDEPNGPGSYVAPNGDVWQGHFVGGKPDGLVLVTNADGTQSTETWKDGEKIE